MKKIAFETLKPSILKLVKGGAMVPDPPPKGNNEAEGSSPRTMYASIKYPFKKKD